MHTCQDYSDRVFRLNQTCNEAEYVQKYSQTVCSGDIYNGDPDDIKYCKDLDAIMKEHNTSDYWDPHQCINSCIDPGYGCQACTNPDYFKCTKDSQSVCIHPKLVCNHHPDCDNVEDEQLDNCYDIYVKNGLVDEFATLKCASKLYPNMETVATVCDGIEECHGGEDEPNTCKNSNGNIFLGVSVGTVIGVYLCLKLFTYTFSVKIAFLIIKIQVLKLQHVSRIIIVFPGSPKIPAWSNKISNPPVVGVFVLLRRTRIS